MHATGIDNGEIVLRMALALVLGALVGAERERGGHAAGMRTYAAVCLGSTIFMLVSAYGAQLLVGAGKVDPTRIAAQVVSGIGFLGAGAIFMQRSTVRGLTTAAGIWAVAGIGLAVGAGWYFTGVAATAVMLIVLTGLKLIEDVLFPPQQRIILKVTVQEKRLDAVRQALADLKIRVRSVDLQVVDADTSLVKLSCSGPFDLPLERLTAAIRQVADLVSVEASALHPLDEDEHANHQQ
jgi:putative Mg2+ transporter-C (MgtC) family protein